jgi:hypothetical protein
MDETTFWQMIEQAKATSEGDDNRQVVLLTHRLAQLDVSEILAFEAIYARYEAQAYRQDMWDAVWFIHKGCSEDAFTDFRAWLIAQGEKIFRQVLADPDALADIVPVQVRRDIGKFGEVMGSLWVAADAAYELRTGEEKTPRPPVQTSTPLTNRSIEIDAMPGSAHEFEMSLKERYPRIAAKFWDDEDYS